MRFLVEKNISGMSWIKLPSKKYKVKNLNWSFCINEIEIDVNDLISVNDINELADLRLMSFDIECSSFGKFPDPNKH